MSLQTERQNWRERFLCVMSWACVIAGVASVLVTSLSDFGGISIWIFLVAIALVLVSMFFSRLPYRLRVLMVLFALLSACLVPMAKRGFLPNILNGLLVICLVATLLRGRRWGFASSLFGGIAILLMGALFATPYSALDLGWIASYDPTEWKNAVRFAAMFVVLSGLAVVGVSSILERAEALLIERSQALESLRIETREKEEAQSRLLQSEEAFRKAAEIEVLGRLAGYAAHDFNNALLVIRSSVTKLRRDARGQPALVDELSQIESAADQATTTVGQLRGFGRNADSTRVLVDLEGFMSRTVRMLRSILPASIQIETEVGSVPAIRADPGELQRILTNLALNARDAMRAGGKLRFEVDADVSRKEVLIRAIDSGLGMSTETQQKIFEPFFTTKGDSGTGLGLASVRESVEANGGTVLVDSTMGVGSRFEIRWPADEAGSEPAEEDGSEPIEKAEGEPRSSGRSVAISGSRVLLVDDDELIRNVISRQLLALELKVTEAERVEEALRYLDRGDGFDLLFTDWSMPGLPVSQLIERFRELLPEGRIVVSSGTFPKNTDPSGPRWDVLLPKPFSIEELRAVIGDLFRSNTQTEQASADD